MFGRFAGRQRDEVRFSQRVGTFSLPAIIRGKEEMPVYNKEKCINSTSVIIHPNVIHM